MSYNLRTLRLKKRATPRVRSDERRTLFRNENNIVHTVNAIKVIPNRMITLPCFGEMVLKYQAEIDNPINPAKNEFRLKVNL